MPKVQKCRMLGYDPVGKNVYTILNLEKGTILARKDVLFNENITEEDIKELTVNNYYNDNNDIDIDGYNNDKDDWVKGTIASITSTMKLPDNPKTIDEALQDSIYGGEWREAILNEIVQFENRGIFGAADQSGRCSKTKFIFKYSFTNELKLKLKCRLVFCGYNQRLGIDYTETYSPTTSILIVKLLIDIAAKLRLKLFQFDVTAAFLEGKADIINFCRLPPEVSVNPQGDRVAVLGNCDGQKQAPVVFNKLFHSILVDLDFERSSENPCLYLKVISHVDWIMCCIHVDDGLCLASKEYLVQEFMRSLNQKIQKVTAMREFKKYLGIEITEHLEDGLTKLGHTGYIESKFSDENMTSNWITSPMSVTSNLRIAESNVHNDSLLPITGVLRFVADRARYDILAATGEVSAGGESPSDEHVKVAKRICQYLVNTADLGLMLGGDGLGLLFGYCDASHNSWGDCKSRLGGCVFHGLNSGAILAYSNNNTVVGSTLSHSSCEAEIKAIDLIVLHLIHIYNIFVFLGVEVALPIVVYCDNKSAIEICETLKMNHNVKHINLRINFVREQIEGGFIKLLYINTEDNVADVLTKALTIEKHARFINVLMNGHGGKFAN